MSLLTDPEVNAVLEAAIRGSGPLCEAQLQGVLDWAHFAKTQATVLALVIQGRLVIDVTEPEPVFRLAEDCLRNEDF
jgi:hypothetical protein